jgi:hypothetical protein
MLIRVMKLPAEVRLGYDLSSLHCVLHAAAPCPVEVKYQVIEWLGPIVSEFGKANDRRDGLAREWCQDSIELVVIRPDREQGRILAIVC